MSGPGPNTSLEGDDDVRHLYAGVEATLPTAPVWLTLADALNCSPLEIFGFHVAAVCYAQAHRTDGILHADAVYETIGALIAGEPFLYAEALVNAGLWAEVDDLHYAIIGWAKTNTTQAEWERNREVCRQAGRNSGAARREPRGSEQDEPRGSPPNQVVQPSGEQQAKHDRYALETDSPDKMNHVAPSERGGRGGSVQTQVLLLDPEETQERTDPDLIPGKGTKKKHGPADLQTIWNDGCGRLPKWIGMPEGLARMARARLKELPDLDTWRKVVIIIATNPFCTGKNNRKWHAGPSFLLRELTWSRCLNGEIDSWGREQMTANERRQDIADRNKASAPSGRLNIITGDEHGE